jgi:hypothetical protein
MSKTIYLFFLLGLALTSVSTARPTTLLSRTPSIVSTLASPAPPDFELRADPTNATLPLDKIANITILVHAVNGFTGSVKLELTQPISSDYGPSCPDLNQPKTVTPNPDATWTFTCTSGDNVVSYTLFLKGTAMTPSGRLIRTMEVTLNFTPTNASSSIPSTDPFQFSISPTYAMIGAITGAFLITLIALTSHFRKRHAARHSNPLLTKPQ